MLVASYNTTVLLPWKHRGTHRGTPDAQTGISPFGGMDFYALEFFVADNRFGRLCYLMPGLAEMGRCLANSFIHSLSLSVPQ